MHLCNFGIAASVRIGQYLPHRQGFGWKFVPNLWLAE